MRYYKVSAEDRVDMGLFDAIAAAILHGSEWVASFLSADQVNKHRGKEAGTFKLGKQEKKALQGRARLQNTIRATGHLPYGLLSDKTFDKIRESEGAIYDKLKTHLSRFTQDGTLPEDKAFEFLLQKCILDILTMDVPEHMFAHKSAVCGQRGAGERGADVLFFMDDERAPIRGVVIAQAKWQVDIRNGFDSKNPTSSGLLKCKELAEKFYNGNSVDIPDETVKKYIAYFAELNRKYAQECRDYQENDSEEAFRPVEPKIYIVCASPKFADTDRDTWGDAKALKLDFNNLLFILKNDLSLFQLPIPMMKDVFLNGLQAFEVQKKENRQDWLGTITGFDLCHGLYDVEKNALKKEHGLLYTNVRDRLTSSDSEKGMSGDIRRAVKETIRDNPADFFSKNNGLTLIVKKLQLATTDVSLRRKQYSRLQQPQLVNGGQTLNTLWDLYESEVEEDRNLLHSVKIPVKIVVIDSSDDEYNRLATAVAVSSNHQNSVVKRDLEALTTLMRNRQRSIKQFSNQEDSNLSIYFATKNGEWEHSLLPEEKEKYIKQIGNSKLEMMIDNFSIGKAMWSIAGGGQLSSNMKEKIWDEENLKNAIFSPENPPDYEEKRLLVETGNVWRLSGDVENFLREAIFCKFIFNELTNEKIGDKKRPKNHYSLVKSKLGSIKKDIKLTEELKKELAELLSLTLSPYFMSLIINQALRIRTGGSDTNRVRLIDYLVGGVKDANSTLSKVRQRRTFSHTGDVAYAVAQDSEIMSKISHDPLIFNNGKLSIQYSSKTSDLEPWSLMTLFDICHRAVYTAADPIVLTGKRADKENKTLIDSIIGELSEDTHLKFLHLGDDLESEEIKKWNDDVSIAFVLLGL